MKILFILNLNHLKSQVLQFERFFKYQGKQRVKFFFKFQHFNLFLSVHHHHHINRTYISFVYFLLVIYIFLIFIIQSQTKSSFKHQRPNKGKR